MLFTENMDKYEGRTLSHFENEFGKKLENLSMLTSFVIVFTDGSKISLGQDWRGGECYFSQYRL